MYYSRNQDQDPGPVSQHGYSSAAQPHNLVAAPATRPRPTAAPRSLLYTITLDSTKLSLVSFTYRYNHHDHDLPEALAWEDQRGSQYVPSLPAEAHSNYGISHFR